MREIIAAKVEAFNIDGNIDKSVWGDMIDLLECARGVEPVRKTCFKPLNDGEYLYFGFKVYDDNIMPMRTTYNSKIYMEEVVEVFISGSDRRRYIELEVSPNNTQLVGKIKNSLKGSRTLKLIKKSIIDSAVLLTDYGYSVEIKVKIKSICDNLNVSNLRECYMNAYRIDRPKDKEWELSALQPTGREGFHYPESFVRMILEE